MKVYLIIMLIALAVGETPTPSSIDENSYANFDQVVTEILTFYWELDFDFKYIDGSVTHTMKVLQETDTVYLDVQGLDITSVKDSNAAGADLEWEILEGNPNIGDALKINLGSEQTVGTSLSIYIEYLTTSDSMALSWLSPEQTSSKTLSFMYTQCESIFAKSLAPLQDSPSVKSVYSAIVIAPDEYQVLMSAYPGDAYELDVVASNAKTLVAHTFQQTNPIPSYLIAIAAGNLVYQEVGTRTGIYAEPTIIDSAVSEYEDLETFLDTAEAYMTQYEWDYYNILFLPPSFPYGGMENPLMTFYNPILITGDKSLTNIATHEISHSWTGNYVTCADWANLWLNEGFTTFEERKVSGILYGKEFRMTEFYVGSLGLYSFIDSVGPDSEFTSLNPQFNGDSPDIYTTTVPYEKGAEFLYYLETILGEDIFQDFLRSYLDNFAWESVFAEQLQEFWETYITEQVQPTDPEIAEAALEVDWDAWVFQPGYPPVHQDFSNSEVEAALTLADNYVQLQGQSSPDYSSYDLFNNNQKIIFLDEIQSRADEISLLLIQRIDMDLSISNDPNPIIKFHWQTLGIQFHYENVLEQAHEYITSNGRTAWIKPVYESLVKYGYRHLAYQWMKEAENFYHPITLSQLKASLLKQEELTDLDIKNIQRYERTIKQRGVIA